MINQGVMEVMEVMERIYVSIIPARAAVSRISAQYLVFPTTVYVDSTISMTVCLVNEGETGQLIYDGRVNTDHVVVSIPIDSNFDDLAESPIFISCSTTNPSWICEEPRHSLTSCLQQLYYTILNSLLNSLFSSYPLGSGDVRHLFHLLVSGYLFMKLFIFFNR